MIRPERADIVIPVYNAYDDLVVCVDSILRHTDMTKHRLILVNDASPDERIMPYLKSLECESIIVSENVCNSGFSATVNHGIEISGDNAGLYVLIRYLGSQTEEEILRRSETLGMPLKSLKGYYQNLPPNYLPTFLLGFANLNEETIPDAIRSLSEKVFASPKPYLL